MCSGKGAGSPQGYNTGVVPPAGGMQQFSNVQNQFQKSPWDATLQRPSTLMGSQPGLASTQPVTQPGQPGYQYTGENGWIGTPENPVPWSTGGGDPYNGQIPSGYSQGYTPNIGGASPQGRPTNTNGDPGLGAGYVRPEMGLLGGGPVGGPTRTGGMTPMQTGSQGTINNPNMTPELQAQLDFARQTAKDNLAGSGFDWRPRPGGPGLGPDHTGWGGGQKTAQLGPARDGGLARMAAGANYQQSLTPEMIQQQVNNQQRAPTSYAQLQGMLGAMDPAKRADYIAKYKAITGLDPTSAPTPGTPGNIFGS